MTDRLTPQEIAEAFGWASSLIDGHRALNGRDEALGLALLSTAATLLIPQWGAGVTRAVAGHIIRQNALAIAPTGAVQ